MCSGKSAEPEDLTVRELSEETALRLYEIHANLIAESEAKRQQANQVYFTLVAALVAYSASISESPGSGALALALVMNLIWTMQLFHYRRIARAKFLVVAELEGRFAFRPFAEEWKHLKETGKSRAELTQLELIPPIVLTFLIAGLLGFRHFDNIVKFMSATKMGGT